jgi:hypothetical protein
VGSKCDGVSLTAEIERVFIINNPIWSSRGIMTRQECCGKRCCVYAKGEYGN